MTILLDEATKLSDLTVGGALLVTLIMWVVAALWSRVRR